MSIRLRHNRDALAGLLFIALGVIGFVVALSYSFGSLGDMGPGFFPRVLSFILIGFGIVTLVKGLRFRVQLEGNWNWLALILLVTALVGFGWLMEHVGLLPALFVLIFVSALAGREFKLVETLILIVVLSFMAVAIFIWGLGLPYSLFNF